MTGRKTADKTGDMTGDKTVRTPEPTTGPMTGPMTEPMTGPMEGPVTGRGTVSEPVDAEAARERLRRWRLVLGGDPADGTGHVLCGRDAAMDGALTALYGRGGAPGRAGTVRRGSGPRHRRWRAGWGTSGPTSRLPWSR